MKGKEREKGKEKEKEKEKKNVNGRDIPKEEETSVFSSIFATKHNKSKISSKLY